MGHVDVAGIRYELPDGRVLLDDVSFRVGEGAKVALVGANGAGKTTLLRIVTGELVPHEGAVTRSGGLGVMRQMVGRDSTTVRELLLSVSPDRVRAAAAGVERWELALMDTDDERTQMKYAEALSEWGDAGGYDLEVAWDVCCTAALGVPYERVKYRDLSTLSGGEQKRLVLEFLLAGPDEVLLLDEPDNFLDVPGKLWLEQRIRESVKTILFISHDRELLNNTATRVVTVELGAAGNSVWTHPGGFASYHDARRDRFARFEELRRRWDEEHAKLKALVLRYKIKAEYNDGLASQYRAAQTRLRKFEEKGPPTGQPREQQVSMRLTGGRTGKRAVVCEQLELVGLMKPFDLEVWYGERVAVLGSNGSGKSHFLRLLAIGGPTPTSSTVPSRRARPPRPSGRSTTGDGMARRPGGVWGGSCRPMPIPSWSQDLLESCPAATTTVPGCPVTGLPLSTATSWRTPPSSASSPCQADNKPASSPHAGALRRAAAAPGRADRQPDVESAEASRTASSFAGTVLAVTHHRWFARGFTACGVGCHGSISRPTEPSGTSYASRGRAEAHAPPAADGRQSRPGRPATHRPAARFLPGCPDSRWAAWPATDAARRAGVRLVALNRPGYGASHPARTSHASVAADVVAVADEFALDDVAPGGHVGRRRLRPGRRSDVPGARTAWTPSPRPATSPAWASAPPRRPVEKQSEALDGSAPAPSRTRRRCNARSRSGDARSTRPTPTTRRWPGGSRRLRS